MSNKPGPFEINAAALMLSVHVRNEAAEQIADSKAREAQDFALRMRAPIKPRKTIAAKRKPLPLLPLVLVATVVVLAALQMGVLP